MNKQPSPLQKLLTRFGIGAKPAPAFQPYDRVIPHPALPGETLTLHYVGPGHFKFDAEAVKNLENWPLRRMAQPLAPRHE